MIKVTNKHEKLIEDMQHLTIKKERKWARVKVRVRNKNQEGEGARKGRREGGERMKKIMKANRSENITLTEDNERNGIIKQ